MEEKIFLKNPNSDFYMVQNYVIQLVSEGKISAQAFLLYSFYQSLHGFEEIRVSYRYINENTGIAMGSISRCNKALEECGLINRIDNGIHKAFTIELAPNHTIPRRTLKAVHDMNDELPQVNTEIQKCSPDEPINRLQQDISFKEITTTTERKRTKKLDTKITKDKPNILFNKKEQEFIEQFVKCWTYHYQTKYYTKSDFDQIKKINDLDEASKYIKAFWCLDEVDEWVRNSDHSFTVFTKEYKNGKLQAIYPNTIYAQDTPSA